MISDRSLWRNRDYVLLWSGQAVSNVGSQVTNIAFPLLTLALTGSPTQAGIVGGIGGLTYLLLALPAGALVDRWDRQRTMILCDLGRSLTMASIPAALLLHHLSLLQLYAVAFITGSLFVFFNLAATASLPAIVPREQLGAASAQDQFSGYTAVLIGPWLGGGLYAAARFLPFAADAVSYAVSTVSLALIRTALQGQRPQALGEIWAEVKQGLVWLWHHRALRFTAFLSGGYNFVSSGITIILIVAAQRVHTLPGEIGLIFAGGSVGGICGSLIASRVDRRLGIHAITAGGLWAIALLWLSLAAAKNAVTLALIFAGVLFVSTVVAVKLSAYRLMLIPDDLRGRVNSVFRLVSWGMIPAGTALTGVFLQSFGVASTVFAGTVCLCVLAIAATSNPDLKHVPLSNVP